MRWLGWITAACALACAPAAQAQWAPATAAELFARSQQKGADQLAHPEYAQLTAPHLAAFADGTDSERKVNVDPYRLG